MMMIFRYWNRENDSNYTEALAKYNDCPEAFPDDPRQISLYYYAVYFERNWIPTGRR